MKTSRSRFMPLLGTGSADPAMIAKINAYAEKHLTPGTRRDADTAVAAITYRLKIRQDRMPAIAAWLDKQG